MPRREGKSGRGGKKSERGYGVSELHDESADSTLQGFRLFLSETFIAMIAHHVAIEDAHRNFEDKSWLQPTVWNHRNRLGNSNFSR